jgi:hypothetical protein
VLAVVAFRLVRSSGNKWWQYLIVLVAVATPILTPRRPHPSRTTGRTSWVAAAWTIGLIALA